MCLGVKRRKFGAMKTNCLSTADAFPCHLLARPRGGPASKPLRPGEYRGAFRTPAYSPVGGGCLASSAQFRSRNACKVMIRNTLRYGPSRNSVFRPFSFVNHSFTECYTIACRGTGGSFSACRTTCLTEQQFRFVSPCVFIACGFRLRNKFRN
jgi:hypothetical protein